MSQYESIYEHRIRSTFLARFPAGVGYFAGRVPGRLPADIKPLLRPSKFRKSKADHRRRETVWTTTEAVFADLEWSDGAASRVHEAWTEVTVGRTAWKAPSTSKNFATLGSNLAAQAVTLPPTPFVEGRSATLLETIHEVRAQGYAELQQNLVESRSSQILPCLGLLPTQVVTEEVEGIEVRPGLGMAREWA